MRVVANLPIAVKVAVIVAVGLISSVSVGVIGSRGLSNTKATATDMLTHEAMPAIDFGATREAFGRMPST